MASEQAKIISQVLKNMGAKVVCSLDEGMDISDMTVVDGKLYVLYEFNNQKWIGEIENNQPNTFTFDHNNSFMVNDI